MDIETARANLNAARAASERARVRAAASERALQQLMRSVDSADPQLAEAVAARDADVQTFRTALDAERAARGALDALIASSLPVDGAEDVAALTADFPIVLFPVRIETRFATDAGGATSLKVRIYPDELMADTHEPGLTDAERDAGTRYWQSGWQPEGERQAWRELLAYYPPPRAAWIVRALAPTNLASRPAGSPLFPDAASRATGWTRPAETDVLPDRWIVIGYRSGVEVARGVGLAIGQPLALSMSPAADEAATVAVSDDGLQMDEGLAWMVDYDRAVQAGMAVTLPTTTDDMALGFDRVIVVGVKSSLAPDKTAIRLAEQLDAHHYTKGFAVLPQGTPTNNTTDAPSAFPVVDTDGALSFAVERGDPLTGPDSNGTLLTRALGVAEDAASHIAASDLREQPHARAMNEALWPVTWRYFLDQLMDPVVPDAAIDVVRDHFVNHVRGRGPLPAFRTGSTPYGLLPVSSLSRWRISTSSGPLETHLVPLLRNLRDIWMEQIDRVPRMGTTVDPDDDLIAVLGMDASSREARARAVLGPQMQGQLFAALNIPIAAWLQGQRTILHGLVSRLGHPEWNARVGAMGFADGVRRFIGSFVAPRPLSETEPLHPFNYINWIRTTSLTQLQQEQLPPGMARPRALLYLLLRQGALNLYAGAASTLAVKHNLMTRAERIEPEVIGIAVSGHIAVSGLERLNQKIPNVTGAKTLGEFLADGHGQDAAEIHAFRAALAVLETLPVAELDRLCTETLDTCSHRLDAWITSLASRRLGEMRAQTPIGAHLGAFAFVENLRPDTTPPGTEPATSGGFIHAPSSSHAAAAAILRNAYVTRSGMNAERYAVDLSSRRVRAALELLDGVREGQPLGAILGYRFERGLHEGHRPLRLEKYIDPFRRLFPLVADKAAASGEAAESIAARNVVDGLLLRAASQAGTIPWGQSGLPAAGADRAAIEDELRRLDEAVDGVADVLASESVFQLVRGNTTRAASILDAAGQGLRPPEPEITQQPRRGTALTHRVALVLGGDPVPDSGWSAIPATPRAAVEPYLDAWIGSILGDPAQIQCRLSFTDHSNSRITDPVRLSELGLRALDVMAIAKGIDAQGGMAELDGRIAARAPADARDIEVQYSADLAWNRRVVRTFFDAFEVARAINALLAGSRALDPRDLLAPEEAQLAGQADRLAAESTQRAARTETLVADARQLLDDALQTTPADVDSLRSALRTVSLFGVAGAFPLARGTDEAAHAELRRQAESASAELGRRISAAADAAALPEKAQAVFGPDFVILPRFRSVNGNELSLALAAGPGLVGDAIAVAKWMQQASRVRPGLSSLRRLSLLAGTLERPPMALAVAQLPHAPDARWAALPFTSETDRPESGRLSLVFHRAATASPSEEWVGLIVDEWTELIPARTEDTAIAFHYDDPGAEAAQAVLIAVPPGQTLNWDFGALIDTLNETFDLAKIRAVDGELLPLGQLLPAIYLTANPRNDTLSTNLRAVLANAAIS